MNWRIKPTVLFLFSLSIFFSCDTPNDIGLEGIGDSSTLDTFYTEEPVEAATVLANDSILAFQPNRLLVGTFSDAATGNVTAKSFLEVGLFSGTAGSTFTNAPNVTVDSMVLALDYDEYYGDTTQNITVRVHRLTEGFSDTKSYFANSSLAFNEATNIGSKTFKPTPLAYKRIETTSIKKRSYPLRIRLNNSFAQEFVALSGTTKLTNPQEFLNFLPGIALTADNNAKSVLGFNLLSMSDSTYQTYMTIYYKATGNTTTQYKYNFIVNSNNNHSIQLTANRANTPLAGLQNSGNIVPSTSTNNLTYLQESTGVKTKITFPNLHTFKERMAAEKKLSNVVINRAELIVPVKSNPAAPSPSPLLYLFETDATRNKILRNSGIPRAVSPDGGGNLFNYSSLAPLFYNKDTKSYSLNITSYVQAIVYGTSVQGRSASRYLILSPSNQLATTGNEALALQTLRQTVLSMEPGNSIKLRIFYSGKQ